MILILVSLGVIIIACLYSEFSNIDRICNGCNKTIHFWNTAINAFSGRYHSKCFYSKDSKIGERK